MITEITGGSNLQLIFTFLGYSRPQKTLRRYDLDCVIAYSCTTSNGDKHRPFQLLCYSFSFCIHSLLLEVWTATNWIALETA